jgi:hypothetical protein
MILAENYSTFTSPPPNGKSGSSGSKWQSSLRPNWAGFRIEKLTRSGVSFLEVPLCSTSLTTR